MAPEIDINAVRQEIHSWIQAYNFEKLNLGTDEIIEPDYEWNEMMKKSDLLKQKYSFLSDFMKKNGINIVEEEEYSDEILDKSWMVTHYEHDSNGIKYYIVKGNDEIVEVPYNINDQTWDYEFLVENSIESDLTKWEKVWDFVDKNTTHILRDSYDISMRDISSLYVIPYVK